MKIITLALTGLFLFPGIPTQAPTQPAPVTVEQKILSVFKDERMVAIGYCESTLQQLKKDGSPKISPTSDVGIMQVNQIHWAEARKLGLDIFNDEDDNIAMGKVVYDKEGITAWTTYKSQCYNKYLKDKLSTALSFTPSV